MNSMEEDALFNEWGWEKDLIQRKWFSPKGITIAFDTVMELGGSETGEEVLVHNIKQYGEQVDRR